jgi:hypothetical protein
MVFPYNACFYVYPAAKFARSAFGCYVGMSSGLLWALESPDGMLFAG